VRKPNSLSWLCLAAVLFAAGGAACPYAHMAAPPEPLPPPAFERPPTLEEVISAVNRNTAAVNSLSSDTVTLRVEGPDLLTKAIPPLRGNLAWEAPHNFRLTARLSSLTGTEVDIGSNPELFWIWSRWLEPPPGQPPAIFYARHDEFAHSPLRQLAPIEPRQIVEALGLTHLPPDARYQGPNRLGNGLVEITMTTESPQGQLTRTLLVHEQYGWVEQQHLTGADGQPIASMTGSRHRYYAEAGAVLPLHMEIQLANPNLKLIVDVADYQLNAMYGDPVRRWTMPRMDGYQALDIGRAALPAQPAVAPLPPTGAQPAPYGYPQESLPPAAYQPPGAPPTAYSAENTHGPRYRGYR